MWVNGVGGLTFRTDDDRYIKFGPRNEESSFAGEAERLEWAAVHPGARACSNSAATRPTSGS